MAGPSPTGFHRCNVGFTPWLNKLPFQLEFVGDGPTRVATSKLVRSLGLTDRVRFLGDCDNVAALAAQLRPLLADAALRRRQGAAGRRRFEAKFRFEVMLEHTLAIYERVLAAVRDRSRPAHSLAWGRGLPL